MVCLKWSIAFSYFQLSNSFSFGPTGFSVQNLAAAILSLCEMERLQHLSSLGKFSKRCLEKNREKNNYFFIWDCNPNKTSVLYTLCNTAILYTSTQYDFLFDYRLTEHTVNVINRLKNPSSFCLFAVLSV